MSEGLKAKSIFEYSDYRELLRDLYSLNKAKSKKFSHRFFAKQAGFATPNFLKLVMDGKSNVSEESIEKFIRGFKFNREEGHFFKHLVLLNQATTSEQKQFHATEILRSRSYKKIFPLKEAQYNFFANWYFIPVWESVRLKGFKEDPEWIASKILGSVTPAQVKKALEELQKLGLLVRGENGNLAPTNENLTTPDEVSSVYLTHWHKEMLNLASQSIDTIPRNKRDISSVTLSIPEGAEVKLKELMQKFRREVLELLSQESECTSIYQLNLQLFPLAEVRGEDG